MDALLMCGGLGSRLATDGEKPLFEVGGRAMVDRVCDALEASHVERIHAVTSPQAPATRAHLEERGVRTIDTPGSGYVTDLQTALAHVETPVLTVAADLPLLAGDTIDWVLERHSGGALTVCVPAALKRLIGVRLETTMTHDGRTVAPTGLNVVTQQDEGRTVTSHDVRIAVNVNYRSDATIAQDLL